MQKSYQQDINNFSEKYSLYGEMLFRICMVYLCNKEDAEEAMQESFFKFLYNSPQFKNDEHEKAWLVRITINVCKDMLRSVWHKRVVKMENIQSYSDNLSDMNTMEAILKLPSKYKAVIYLYYFEGYTINHISETIKITESAVKMRLKRGRDILKIELKGEQL
jgi:RNA polymerase sigma factor (sigma-70 family)